MLHGRDPERARLRALVDEACEARAGALVLHGEPGVGKTALLDDLIAGADGLRVLRTQGLESESPLAYAALHRLLRPVLRRRDRLPVPQAHALGVAFGEQDAERVDPFLVAVATLSLLTEAAEEQPVLAVVDDAHWLDAASADALLFAARRLGADRVVLLFSVRDGAPTTFRHDGVPSLLVEQLDDAAARHLLADAAGQVLAEDVAERLLEQSSGNALALVEMARSLDSAQLAGTTAVPGLLPLTATMERVFLDRARRLPGEVQSFLLVAAADDSGQVSTVSRAASILGLHDGVLAHAEASGLMVSDGDALRVRHPLVRSALYRAASGRERREVHRALAVALEGDSDRQVWHRAAAAEGPDDALATALDEAGDRAERRGGFAAACEAYERSAELTPSAALRAERCFAAARNAWAAAMTNRARGLLAMAMEQSDDPPLRADIDRLRGRIEVNVGSGAGAHRIYVTAALAVADHSLDRALDLAVAASGLAAYCGDSGLVLPPAAVQTAVVPGDTPRRATLKRLLLAMTVAAEDRWRDAVGRFHEALDTGTTDPHPDVLAHLGQAALHIGDDTAAERCFTSMLGAAREAGAGMTVLYALPRLAFPLFLSGQWSAARGAADEALALSVSTGQPSLSATPLAWLELLAALRGEDDPGLPVVDDPVEQHQLGILAGPTSDLRRWARGTRAAHAGAALDAHHHLSQMEIPALARMAALDRIDAAVRAGDVGHARAWVDELVAFADATRWPWALGAADHGKALTSTGDGTARLFDSSLAHYGQARRPYDLARTHLAYGEHLRRSQQRVDARFHLRRALEICEDLRAEPLAARAARELRASGETARKRDVSTQLLLTPTELQVAQLVRQGMSNKEVAAHCWISPRTVAFHLRNVFAKTGVSSRGELAQLELG